MVEAGQTLTDKDETLVLLKALGEVVGATAEEIEQMGKAFGDFALEFGTAIGREEVSNETKLVAELSALDLGARIRLQAKAKGTKYTYHYGGYLTEVHHNKSAGYTSLRLVQVRTGETLHKETLDRIVRESDGYARQFLYGETVEIIEPPQ